MTLQIIVSSELAAKLRRRAAASGKDVKALVREAVEEKLRQDESLAEILAPVHAAFRSSGVTQRKAMNVFQRARKQVRLSSGKILKPS